MSPLDPEGSTSNSLGLHEPDWSKEGDQKGGVLPFDQDDCECIEMLMLKRDKTVQTHAMTNGVMQLHMQDQSQRLKLLEAQSMTDYAVSPWNLSMGPKKVQTKEATRVFERAVSPPRQGPLSLDTKEARDMFDHQHSASPWNTVHGPQRLNIKEAQTMLESAISPWSIDEGDRDHSISDMSQKIVWHPWRPDAGGEDIVSVQRRASTEIQGTPSRETCGTDNQDKKEGQDRTGRQGLLPRDGSACSSPKISLNLIVPNVYTLPQQ